MEILILSQSTQATLLNDGDIRNVSYNNLIVFHFVERETISLE